jgi:hypothetical protein
MDTPTHVEIPVTLHLSEHAGIRLAARAEAAGKGMPEYVAALVESIVEYPRTLAEISGQSYDRFVSSGTTDQELAEELDRAKHEMRDERHSRHAP